MAWPEPFRVGFLSVDEGWALDDPRRGETLATICEGLSGWFDAQHVAERTTGLHRQ